MKFIPNLKVIFITEIFIISFITMIEYEQMLYWTLLILMKKIAGFTKNFKKTCSAEKETLGFIFYIKNINLKAEFFKEYFLFHFKNKLVF